MKRSLFRGIVAFLACLMAGAQDVDTLQTTDDDGRHGWETVTSTCETYRNDGN
ncbi:MAG: hypothetical protein IKZ92_06895 [Muribaculaceae bacterium]|nr:hypothetical protein [Muribaculaceae bacterium]